MGITTIRGGVRPFATLEDGQTDGVRSGQIIGTYLHGAFENTAVLEEVLGYRLPDDGARSKNAQYDLLADWFAAHVDHDVLAAEYL